MGKTRKRLKHPAGGRREYTFSGKNTLAGSAPLQGRTPCTCGLRPTAYGILSSTFGREWATPYGYHVLAWGFHPARDRFASSRHPAGTLWSLEASIPFGIALRVDDTLRVRCVGRRPPRLIPRLIARLASVAHATEVPDGRWRLPWLPRSVFGPGWLMAAGGRLSLIADRLQYYEEQRRFPAHI